MTLLVARERETVVLPVSRPVLSEDAMVICPKCKAMQSVQISEGRMTPTRKFAQIGMRVFHDCGSEKPCRILHNI